MDIDDEDIFNCFFDENQKIIRNYQNSKIMNNNDIYQNEDILKLKSDNNKFYINKEIQDNSIKFLTSCSNFIYYISNNNYNSIYEAKQQIKNNFNQINDISINNNNNEFKNELNEMKNKIFKDKFKDNPEYKNLCELINQKDFDEKMTKNEDKKLINFLI